MTEFAGLHAAMLTGKRDRGAGKRRDAQEQHLALANHPGLIPSARWLSCQYKLDENRRLGGRGRGRHTWLSGLLRCGACGYSVKVNRNGEKYYLLCSGRSNLGLCDRSIHVDLRELESGVAAALGEVLAECPESGDEPEEPYGEELEQLERRLERLMDALSESSDLSMAYVNRAVARLEAQRAMLLEKRAEYRSRPPFRRICFASLDPEQKKLTASQFIREIRLSGDEAEVIWNV